MHISRPLLLWETVLTFLTIVASGIGLLGIGTQKEIGAATLIVQALNAATIFYKLGQTGQSPPLPPPSPVTVVVPPHPPEGPLG